MGKLPMPKPWQKRLYRYAQTTSLKTIDGFKNALRGIVKGNPNKYFAQVFQALRIEVNDELDALKEMLQQIPLLAKTRWTGSHHYVSFSRRQVGKKFFSPRNI